MAETVLAKMAVQIAANTAEFGKSLKGAESQFKNFTSGLTRLAGTIGLAFGVKEVTQFAFEVSKLAGEAAGVEAAFKKIPESTKLLQDLTTATAGTVSELDLMKRSVQATNFGIAIEALPDLLKFAALRAQQTGQSVDYLVDSIVTGIGRKSPLILDNLGISAVRLKSQFNGAALEAQSIGDVAKAVGRIAGEELVKMGEFSENVSTKVQRLSASWVNFKVAIGEAANESGILAGALDILSGALENLSGKNVFNQLENELAGFVSKNAGSLIDETVSRLKILRVEAGKPLVFNATELIDKYKLTGEQADILTAKINEINKAFSIQEKAVKLVADFAQKNGYTDLALAADAYKTSLYKLLVQQQSVVAKFKDASIADPIVRDAKEKIGQINSLIEALVVYEKTLVNVGDATTKQGNTFDALQEKLKELNDQFESQTDRNDTKKLSNIGAEIVYTQALIKEINKLREAREKIPKPNVDESNISSSQKPGVGFTTTNVNRGIKEVVPLTNDEMTKRIFEGLDKLEVKNRETTEAISGQWLDLSSSIGGSIADISFAFGQSIAGVGNFGDSIIKALVGFAKQIGEILIGIGTAMLAARKLIKNPSTAIAAGVALVALAGAASAALSRSQSNFNSGGGSGGASVGRGFDRIDSSKPQDMTIKVDDVVLRGQDMYVILKAYTDANKFTKTQNG